MNTVHSVVMAAEFEQMGDHLLGLGTGWTEKGLKLALAVIVVVKVVQKLSMKAGIGALIGLVVCNGIYNSRDDLAGYVKNELLNIGAPAIHAPLYPGAETQTTTVPSAGGERA